MDDPGGQPFGLAPITLADKAVFDRAFSALKQPITDYTFATNFIWGTSLRLYWARLDRHLCLFANGTGDLTLLLPPIPEAGASERDLADALGRCFEVMDLYNDRHAHRAHSRIEYVSDEMLERLGGVRGLNLSAAPMSGDYVYDMARMIDLAGGALKSKRHARSKFVRDFPDHRAEPLDEAHVPACLALLHRWRDHGDAAHDGEVTDSHVGSDILRHRDTLACEVALAHWRDLGLSGMALFVGDKLAGFTLGEPISPTQASILIEKTDPDFAGAAQFIFSEFCRACWSDYPECNAGDDWGIPSLRFTKQSYRPIRLLSKYVLTRQAPVVVGPPAIDVPAQSAHEAMAPAPAAVYAGTAGAGTGDGTQSSGGERMDDLILRPANAGDVTAIDHLEAACFSSVEESFSRRQIRYLIGSPRATVMVAEGAGRVVGWSAALVRQHRRSRSGRLYALAVHPQAQGRGIGRRLVERTLTAFAERGIDRMFLEVRDDNEPALALYRKIGFADHRHLPNYYGTGRHGRRMKLVLSMAPAPMVERPTVTAGVASQE